MAKTEHARWKVGDPVLLVFDKGFRLAVSPEVNASVTKVGRTWIETDNRNYGKPTRFHTESGLIDGRNYGSPGQAYRDATHYKYDTARQHEWNKLASRRFYGRAPQHLTLEQLRQINAWMDGEETNGKKD